MSSQEHSDEVPLPEDAKIRDISRQEETDLEKQEVVEPRLSARGKGLFSQFRVRDGVVYETHAENNAKWYQKLLDVGFEENGIKPVPVEKRTVTAYNNLFTVFFTGLLCLLP